MNRCTRYFLLAITTTLPLGVHALNVDDFGASGDGVTWNHIEIQAAIEAAGPGGLIEFTAGKTYLACNQIKPLMGQTIRGNGATLKRCDAPRTTLIEPANTGDLFLMVDNPDVFEVGHFLTPVKGEGGLNDGDSETNNRYISSEGNKLNVRYEIAQDYPVGSVVTAKFDQINISTTDALNVTIESLVLDGNRANNNLYLGWPVNKAVSGGTGLTIRNSSFKNSPGNAISAFGSNVLITNNNFEDLDGPIIHLSGTLPSGDTFVTISQNTVKNTNLQADRMSHSEGVITISRYNYAIKVLDNTVTQANVPFIGLFHDEMSDWLIDGNNVSDTMGIFTGSMRTDRPELSNIRFSNNQFLRVGKSTITRQENASRIENFEFVDNIVDGGSIQIDGLINSSITNNTIISCGETPINLTQDVNVTVAGNTIANDQCDGTTVVDTEDGDCTDIAPTDDSLTSGDSTCIIQSDSTGTDGNTATEADSADNGGGGSPSIFLLALCTTIIGLRSSKVKIANASLTP